MLEAQHSWLVSSNQNELLHYMNEVQYVGLFVSKMRVRRSKVFITKNFRKDMRSSGWFNGMMVVLKMDT